jgi:WD repeat-containing protein 23
VYKLDSLTNNNQDAAERLSNLNGVEIAFEYTDDNDENDDDNDDDDDEESEGAEDDEEEDEEGEEGETEHPRRPIFITRDQIMQLLGHAGLGRIFATDFTPRSSLRRRRIDEEEDEEEEDSDAGTRYGFVGPTRTSGRRRRPRGRDLFEKVPSEQGKELMQTGTFGSNPRIVDTISCGESWVLGVMGNRRMLPG